MKRSGVLVLCALVATLAACAKRNSPAAAPTLQITGSMAQLPPVTAAPMVAVKWVAMSQPVGSVTTEVPEGWEKSRSKDQVQFLEPQSEGVQFVIGRGDGRQNPEQFLRGYLATVKSRLPDYRELRIEGRLTDSAKRKPYAEAEFTYTVGTRTDHRLVRIYGATFNHPDQPVAWATVEFTAPDDTWAQSRRVLLQHILDKLTWVE